MENEVRLAKIKIDVRIVKEVKETVDNLNNINAESVLPTLTVKDKIHLKTKFVHGKLTNQVQKLTMKMFTEGALNYFIKHKIDPRFFDDSDSLANQVVRLRNQIFSFLQVQERQYLIPLNTNLAELKQKNSTQSIAENINSTRQILAYLVSFANLYFETLDMEKDEVELLKTRLDLFYQATLKQLEGQT
jgi:hypothetical protein